MENEVREFIQTNYILTDDHAELGADQSLMDLGVIDSTGVFALIDFIEETYGITIDDDEILPDNLDSISRIWAFVQRKKA